ncbi:MAG TPA: hypothetical protein VMU22_10865 [Rhizomicrobium sp.]|nr:hypothetical protein [Rhizomicrobium sp.]
MTQSSEFESAIPQQPAKRDLLGSVCFYLHFAVMLTIVGGWLMPWRPALMVYLVFIPGVWLQWLLNKDTCILNNTETWLRTGTWRNKSVNPEEGAWLLTLINSATGFGFSARQIDFLNYSVLVLVWLLAAARLSGLF